ncbi:HipA domain-containing protein [Planctomycetota bacterium]
MLNYDRKTLRRMFGKSVLPTIPLDLTTLSLQAQKMAGKLSISGVQPKLSVRLQDETLVPVDRDGQFILKPQTQQFPELPQNEYLCMQMGREYGLNIADCLLMQLADGSFAYLVKRFDRRKRGRILEKLACEDMHQILGGTSKYAGSHEQMARVIREHCGFAPLELQRLFEVSLFNFAIGNGDAHRKNFSLLIKDDHVALSPAYDLVSSRLVIPAEAEELALTLNGRQNRLTREDFFAFASHLDIGIEYATRKIDQLKGLHMTFEEMIRTSHLQQDLKERFIVILSERLKRLMP